MVGGWGGIKGVGVGVGMGVGVGVGMVGGRARGRGRVRAVVALPLALPLALSLVGCGLEAGKSSIRRCAGVSVIKVGEVRVLSMFWPWGQESDFFL